MGLVSWIVLGALAGWIGSAVMGRKTRRGILINVLIGIVGAGIGGRIASLFGLGSVTGVNLSSILIASAGVALFLFVAGLFSKHS